MRKSEGGNFNGSDEEWTNKFIEAVRLADYVSVGKDYHHLIKGVNTYNSRIIVSYHNFAETPGNLKEIYCKLKNLEPKPDIVKLATKANNYKDTLRMLNLICNAKKEGTRIIGISMDPYGVLSRVVGPLLGSELTFAALDKSKISGPGQTTVDELYKLARLLQFQDSIQQK